MSRRRERRDQYLKQRLPESWQGMPVPVVDDAVGDATTSLRGIGASPGVVEGPVRVVHDPEDADVHDGEILVSATTDPSWAALMFISAGLIVDIGGTLSHAAVVAPRTRHPCVVNTKTGTRALRTGDICRVNGSSGLVEILRRANGSKPAVVGEPPGR